MLTTEAGNQVAQGVASTPAYIWVATAIGIIGLLSGFIRREASGIGEWLSKRRRAATDRDDAERVRTSARLDQLDKDLAEERQERRAETALTRSIIQSMTEHVWDWRRTHAQHGHPYTPPPSPTAPPAVLEYLPPWPQPPAPEDHPT